MCEFQLIPIQEDDTLMQKGQGYITKLVDKNKKFIKEFIWMCCPKCGKPAPATNHNLTKNPDNTITLSPSLRCPRGDCTAHYHIVNSKILKQPDF